MQGRIGKTPFPFKGKEILAKALKDIEKGDLVYIFGGEWGFSPINTGVTGLSTNYQHTVSCSSDGSTVACHKSAPYVYKRTGLTTWTPVNLSANPSGTIHGVALSPSGRYLAFGTDSSPYLFVYEFTGTEYTARSLDSGPGATVYGVSFISDDALAVYFSASPYICVYTTGTTFTRVDPDISSGSLGNDKTVMLVISDSMFTAFTTTSSSYTSYLWSFQNGILSRVLSIGSYTYVRSAARNNLLNTEFLSPSTSTSPSISLYFSSFTSSTTTYNHGSIPYSIYGAAPTQSGFLLATTGGILALDVLGNYTPTPNFSCYRLGITSSTCRGFAWNSDYTLYYTSVNGVLTAIEATGFPCILPATFPTLPYTFYLACALEDIPAGGIGSVFLVGK